MWDLPGPGIEPMSHALASFSQHANLSLPCSLTGFITCSRMARKDLPGLTHLWTHPAPLVVQTLRAYPSTGTDCFLSPRSIPLNLDLVLRGRVQFRLPLPGGAPAVCGCSSRRAPHPVSQTAWHAHPTLFIGAVAAASSTPGRMISMDIPHPSLFSSLKKCLTQRKHRRDEELRRTLWNKLPHLY